ncbi:putative signal peptide protein [Thiobacillus denitrificans ATCC 25259]|uniref:Putative signal peptide protein n=1 Tax=Thiobacillus denitrificans (strain ATCC 25259 / T1) TaxID=292415 RepID=Q3SKW0_THIDA|nr:FMN-binding protein [Thiobacillus denitrificans]AAZ96662.1 putative signal peptide protein [Thiobacillus denitrificans ATCC 25259]
MSIRPDWLIVPAVCAPLLAAAPAFAVQYMTAEAAQKLMFPEASAFTAQPVKLDEAQKRAVEKVARVRMRYPEQPVWQAVADGKPVGWFVLDEVYGKHEFITYAVALDLSGAVRGVEILDYRETHGREVRNPKWRAQFTGKKHGAPLRLDDDIQNISGATLSCKHISEGVRRVLAIHEVALK